MERGRQQRGVGTCIGEGASAFLRPYSSLERSFRNMSRMPNMSPALLPWPIIAATLMRFCTSHHTVATRVHCVKPPQCHRQCVLGVNACCWGPPSQENKTHASTVAATRLQSHVPIPRPTAITKLLT